jgi:C1A family cysteine protease
VSSFCHFFRNVGAVTSVRTQGECGACWAVTAVETVESAYFLASGELYKLSESEVIACDDSCQMCDGKAFFCSVLPKRQHFSLVNDTSSLHYPIRRLATKCL